MIFSHHCQYLILFHVRQEHHPGKTAASQGEKWAVVFPAVWIAVLLGQWPDVNPKIESNPTTMIMYQ